MTQAVASVETDTPDGATGSPGSDIQDSSTMARQRTFGQVGHPRILLVATLRWSLGARVAMVLHDLGARVQAWCPRGHPLEVTTAVEHCYRSHAVAPLGSLRAALITGAPDLVIPCDDDAVMYLYKLFAQSAKDSDICHLVERSLGMPESSLKANIRHTLMRLAESHGVRVPDNAALRSMADLDVWGAQFGFPAVVKADASWGGGGVVLVDNLAEARKAFLGAAHPTFIRALSQWILRRDLSGLVRWFAPTQPGVTIQKYIVGKPANIAVACWRGEILAGLCVLALQTRTPTGPATVVQVMENQEISKAALLLVKSLGLSGLCGLDFVIETSTGLPYLIEMNPRVTPISNLVVGTAPSIVAALHAWVRGTWVSAQPIADGTVIALFPGECLRDASSPYLRTAFHDVPWEEMALVRDCLDKPWEERGIVATIRARLYRRRLLKIARFPPLRAPLGEESTLNGDSPKT